MSFHRGSNTGAQPQSSAARRWSDLFEQCLPAIYRFVFSQVGNREDAEHLTERVFSEAARQLPDPDDLRAACQLLCRLAREHVTAHLRQFYAQSIALDGLAHATEWEQLLAANADHGHAPSEQVERMLGRLHAAARDVLSRRLLAGQPLAAIAAAHRLTSAQAHQLQYDALRLAGEPTPGTPAVSVAQPPRAEPCGCGQAGA